MELRPFSPAHGKILERYLRKTRHGLACYSYVNILIWRCLYDIRWREHNGAFCLFFKDKMGCFMPLPPLGALDQATVDACFETMEALNHNRDISRIDNIEERDLPFFRRSGLSVRERSGDYIVRRDEIASLRGEKFRHRRSLYNHFVKHADGIFRDYGPADRPRVERLYDAWMRDRAASHKDPYYRALLEDSRKAFGELLGLAADPQARLSAKVVSVAGEIAAFTSGFELSDGMFCVNFEIADPARKGLAQFIFTQFARTLPQPEINIMDDSGLENLKHAKRLLRPSGFVPSFTALRKT